MDQEPRTPSLGYKFNEDLRGSQHQDFANGPQLRAAMAKGANLIGHARTRHVALEIQNLQQPARQNVIASAGQKQPADDVQAAESWMNKASKKIKTKASITPLLLSASEVDINIANHTPLGDIGGHRRVNIPVSPTHNQPTESPHTPSSPPSDPSIIPNVEYPAVSDVLEELHRIIPTFDLPQYGLALSDHGVATVDDVRYASNDLFIAIGMPVTILDMFYDYATRMALCAEGFGVSQPRY